MAVSDVSQKYDVIIRIFEILKYQNLLALTVCPIVQITLLTSNNHQFGRLAAKNSNSVEIAFFTFWSNVTFIWWFLAIEALLEKICGVDLFLELFEKLTVRKHVAVNLTVVKTCV